MNPPKSSAAAAVRRDSPTSAVPALAAAMPKKRRRAIGRRDGSASLRSDVTWPTVFRIDADDFDMSLSIKRKCRRVLDRDSARRAIQSRHRAGPCLGESKLAGEGCTSGRRRCARAIHADAGCPLMPALKDFRQPIARRFDISKWQMPLMTSSAIRRPDERIKCVAPKVTAKGVDSGIGSAGVPGKRN